MSRLPSANFEITAGSGGAEGAFRRVERAAKNLADETKQVAAAGKSMDSQLSGAASHAGQAFDGAAKQANNFGSALGRIASNTDALRFDSMAEKIGNASQQLRGLSNGFTEAFLGADKLAGRMNAQLAGAGLSKARDQITDLATALAGLTGGDDDALAAGITQAVVTGKTKGLAEFGIVIDANGQKAIAAANKISQLAGRQETLAQISKAAGGAMNTLRSETSESAQAIGAFNVQYGNFEESVGEGSARVKAAVLGGVLSPLMRLVEASPGLADVAGGVVEVAKTTTSVLAPAVRLWLDYKSATALSTIAIKANTAATILNGDAALVTAEKVGLLSKARGLPLGALATKVALPIAVAYAGAKAGEWGVNALANNPMKERATNDGADRDISTAERLTGWLFGRDTAHEQEGIDAERRALAMTERRRAGRPSAVGMANAVALAAAKSSPLAPSAAMSAAALAPHIASIGGSVPVGSGSEAAQMAGLLNGLFGGTGLMGREEGRSGVSAGAAPNQRMQIPIAAREVGTSANGKMLIEFVVNGGKPVEVSSRIDGYFTRG